MEAIVGGIVIGLAATLMLLFNGRVTGISGILGSLLNRSTTDKSWRVSFIAGLVLGGFMLKAIHSQAFTNLSQAVSWDYAIAGLLVGFGTLLGSGCTSGHGVCGISRFSPRSLVATMTFIAAGIVSVLLFRYLRGEL